jgi:hypothetical protein
MKVHGVVDFGCSMWGVQFSSDQVSLSGRSGSRGWPVREVHRPGPPVRETEDHPPKRRRTICSKNGGNRNQHVHPLIKFQTVLNRFYTNRPMFYTNGRFAGLSRMIDEIDDDS